MNRTAGKHRKSHGSMAWWGHVIVLSLILGSTAISVVTSNPLYAVALIPAAWYIGTRLSSRAPRLVAAGIEAADIRIVNKAGQSYILSEDGSRARVVSL